MKKPLALALFVAASCAQAAVIGLLINYESIVVENGTAAWKCTYNLSATNANAERRTIISKTMCPARMRFD
ncbi:MAG: hypothetical protein Q7J42_09130 [Sulfuritalea sp.]|nr:hypothetical protein [Sulfuritalea sp.]